MPAALPAIPAKRYFTIGEVSELCGVKPYVLRYWEQEFAQLRPMKRRGNRRYYQHHEVLLVRRIRELLYEQGFTISGARGRLSAAPASAASFATGPAAGAGAAGAAPVDDDPDPAGWPMPEAMGDALPPRAATRSGGPRADASPAATPVLPDELAQVRRELLLIRGLLDV